MPTINENTEKSHREEYRIRYVPNAIDNKDGSFKHGFMVQGRTVNHPKLGSSVWENEKAHHTLDDAKKHVDTTIKNDKTGKSHYMAHNEGGVHDGNNMGLHEEIENDTIPPLVDTLIDKNYVDLRTNVHEVIKAKAMDIIDRLRVSVAENFLDKKEDKEDKDDDDKDDKKSDKKDDDSDDKDDKDDDKKEKSDKDDDSKEDGKKDKKFPFFGKKKVDEELLGEISKKGLANYIGSASADKSMQAHEIGAQNALGVENGRPRDKEFHIAQRKHKNRSYGINLAARKLSK